MGAINAWHGYAILYICLLTSEILHISGPEEKDMGVRATSSENNRGLCSCS